MLDNKNCFQVQLLYVGITMFCTNESLTKVVYHMFLDGLIFLNQHHTNDEIKGSEVKDEIMSIVRRM